MIKTDLRIFLNPFLDYLEYKNYNFLATINVVSANLVE